MSEKYELSVTRFIAAPPDRVWQVLADRQGEWFCPAPWRAEIVTQERRAGGRSTIVMHGPEGEAVTEYGIYLAWEEGRRFVATDAVVIDEGGEWQPAGPFMIGTWEIGPEGEGTRYTASARHWTAEARDRHFEMGFEEGWGAAADGLKALCEETEASG